MQFKHLHHKLVIYALSSALLISVIASIIIFTNSHTQLTNQTENSLNKLLTAVESTAAKAAYKHDTAIATDVIEGLLHSELIGKVVVISHKAVLVKQQKKNYIPTIETLTRQLYSPLNKQQHVGQLVVSPATELNTQAAQMAALFNVLAALLLITLTSFVLLWLVRSKLSAPLLKVSDTLHAIKLKKEKRIPVLEQDKANELGRLVTDINNLLNNQEQKLRQEQTLRKSIQYMEKQIRHIYDSSSAGLFLLDIDGELISHNPTLLKVLHAEGEVAHTAIGENFASLFVQEISEFQLMLSDAYQTGELQTRDFLLQQEHKALTPIWIHCLLSNVSDSSGNIHIEGVIFDVSKRVLNEQAIKHKSEHDSLTGLLLRQATRDGFERFMLKTKNPELSIFMLDLDGFKQANDTYGHDVGDKILIKAAQRLAACVTPDDIVCRLGGDEFLVIVLNNSDTDIAIETATKIVTNIQFPMPINNKLSVNVGVSIGIATTQLHGQDFDGLVKAGDEAMYEVKREGKNGYGIKVKKKQINVKLFRA